MEGPGGLRWEWQQIRDRVKMSEDEVGMGMILGGIRWRGNRRDGTDWEL